MSVNTASTLLEDRGDRRGLGLALIAGVVIESFLLTLAGWNSHWLAHPQAPPTDSNFIEAQIFEVPVESHLVEPSKPLTRAKPEVALSKAVAKGRSALPSEAQTDEQNQTAGGSTLAASHGPVAIFSPSPVIPSYLQDKDLHASVVIDFLVSAQGQTTARLVGSSGNEELDAIALTTAKKWQFKPGEKDHQAIDSKVRLRIVFEVK